MKTNSFGFLSGMLTAALLAAMPSIHAQEVTGAPGTTTTTTGGKVLPFPDPKFGGVIKTKAFESTPALNRVAQSGLR